MKTSRKTLYILDGNALLHRAWHAVPPLATKDGLIVNAVYGFTNVVEKIRYSFKPDYLCVAWDLPGKTFRHEAVESYKATRAKKEPELYAQIPMIQELLLSYHVPSYSAPGYEADDVIGTVAEIVKKQNVDVVIVTGDKDALQLVNEKVKIYNTHKEGLIYDREKVLDRFEGLGPEKVVEVMALMGDSSDNYPGIYGIGPKAAEKLINEFGSFENIYRNLSKVQEKTKQKLVKGKKAGQMSYQLAKIVTDLDLKLDFKKFTNWNLGSKEVLVLFEEYGFRSLPRRIGSLSSTKPVSTVFKKNLKMDDIEKVVVQLSAKLKGKVYAIRGTASLVLQGVDMVVDDIDVICDKDSALFLNTAFDDKVIEKETEILYPKAQQTLEKIFWIDDLGFYSFGAAEDGKQVREKNIYSSASILFGLMNNERSVSTIEKFNESDMVTDWGVRNLSNKSSMYEPMNYNYGTIWPFTSYFIGAAQFYTHFNLQGLETVRKSAQHVFDYGLGIVPEVFSGDINTKLGEAYHNQGFSVSGYVFPMIRGLIGLDVDALNNKITFSPKIPVDWKFLKVHNVNIGSAIVNLDLINENGRMVFLAKKISGRNIQIEFSPDLPLGTESNSMHVNVQPVKPALIHHKQAEQLKITFDLEEESSVVLMYKPTVSVFLQDHMTPIGATNEELKIVSQNLDGKKLTVHCEGKPNKDYELEIMNYELVKSISGAELKDGKLIVNIPGTGNDFLKHEIEVEVR